MKTLALVLLLALPASAQELPITQVRFVGGPDLSTFAQTTSVTQVDVQAAGTELSFDKKSGPNRWPDNVTPGWSGTLQYSIGMCVNVDGWVCSAPVEAWYGRVGATGPIQDQTIACPAGHGQVQCNWFYDNRWAPLNGHQPQPGEQIGLFVVAGDARNNFNPVRERSNIVLLNLPGPGQTQTFPYAPVAPQPTPPPVVTPPVIVTPPPVVVAPPPIVSPVTPVTIPTAIDWSQVYAQLATIKADVDAGRAENQAFYADTGSKMAAVLTFVAKYVLPAVGGIVAGWQVTK